MSSKQQPLKLNDIFYGHVIPFGAARAWSPSWWLVSGQNLVSSFQSSERVDDLDEKPMSGEDESIQRLNRSEDFLDNNFFLETITP